VAVEEVVELILDQVNGDMVEMVEELMEKVVEDLVQQEQLILAEVQEELKAVVVEAELVDQGLLL
jgi:flagellar biosynthesis/type III secretory pathway protein FliH